MSDPTQSADTANTAPSVIIPDPPVSEGVWKATVLAIEERLRKAGLPVDQVGVHEALATLQARFAETEAKLAGAEQMAAAATLERDAARKALDTALEEPCTLCGKQRKDRE